VVGQSHVPVHYAKRGEKIGFDGEPDISLRVLSPTTPEATAEGSGDNINNTSIVLRLEYGHNDILLEGDAQLDAESRMVAEEPDELPAQVLKVGHHGSLTSSSPRFLSLVHPQVAIISVGVDNKFGHPAPETLQALQHVRAQVYRTDLDGTIEIIADPDHMWVRADRIPAK
jgi:competence protein ComEC